MDLDSYCKGIGAKNALVNGDTAIRRCARGGKWAVEIDMGAPCRASSPAVAGVTARQLRAGSLTSWVCLRP